MKRYIGNRNLLNNPTESYSEPNIYQSQSNFEQNSENFCLLPNTHNTSVVNESYNIPPEILQEYRALKSRLKQLEDMFSARNIPFPE